MKIDYEGFSIRLNFLLKEKDMSLNELARKIGVYDASIISRWKTGRNGIDSIQTISKIAKELNVKPDWLLYGHINHWKGVLIWILQKSK